MSSATASGQRNALKALAQTPYDVFDVEQAEVSVEKVVYKDEGNETREATTVNDGKALSEDVSMEDEYFQCGYCGDYHEDWIQCESKACTIQWFGLDCAGLVEAPAGRWICAMCRPRPIFPKLSGAPRGMIQDDVQQKPKGVAIKKRKLDKPKPKSGWKGWVEVPDEVKEKMQREAEAQWEITTLPRTNTEIYEGEQKRRLRTQQERKDQRPQRAKHQKTQQRSIPQPWEDDSWSMDDDQLAQEAAAAAADRGRSPPSEPLVHPEDDDITNEEAESIDESTRSRYDRESTFEGFSDSEKADSIGLGLGETGVIDQLEEPENLASGDQSANEISDANEDLDFEMTDDIESGLDELSVMDEDEEAESFQSGDQLADVVSNVDDDQGVGSPASAMEDLSELDVGGGAPMELGVGGMDYMYLDLTRYGPHLVRRS